MQKLIRYTLISHLQGDILLCTFGLERELKRQTFPIKRREKLLKSRSSIASLIAKGLGGFFLSLVIPNLRLAF